MKSILAILEPKIYNFAGLEFRNAKNTRLDNKAIVKLTLLISRKICVAERFLNLHTVPFHLQLLNLHNLKCVTIERFFAAQYQNYSLAVAVFQTL